MSDISNQGPAEGTVAPNPIHEDFVQSAPEDLRDAAMQLAPVWDQYVQSKFNEAADFRKQYEGMTPEDVQDYLAFKELQQNPQQLIEWHQQWDAALRQQHPELFNDSNQFDGLDFGDGFTGQPDPRLSQLESTIQQQQAWIESQQQQAVLREANDWVTSEIDKIKAQSPSLSDQDIDDICALASRYVPDDGSQYPEDLIQRGFNDFQALIGRTERNLFDSKSNQPGPANHGGRSDSSSEAITDFGKAAEMARRLMIQSQQT